MEQKKSKDNINLMKAAMHRNFNKNKQEELSKLNSNHLHWMTKHTTSGLNGEIGPTV